MDSSVTLRSFQCGVNTHGLTGVRKVSGMRMPTRRKPALVSCVKTSESTTSDVSSDGKVQGSVKKDSLRRLTFPSGFEELLFDVCDETEIAELKMKVGDFEMHVKRNVGATVAPLSNISPVEPPPIPTKPMDSSALAPPPPSPPKPTVEKVTPFKNVSFGKPPKLAALEASEASGYVLVASSTVGTFRRSRLVKGKKQTPSCKEGDLIKEGQVIGYLDQFGSANFPVKSDVDGEILKFLFDDGDAVGYGDPLIAVLPSFHGINK